MSVSIKAPDENPSNVESILSDTIGLPGYTINPPGSRIEELLIELNELIKSGGDSDTYATDLSLTIDSSTYVITAVLKNKDGKSIGTPQTIDLPMESVVVSGSYNSQTKKVVLTLQNGSTIEFSVADLIDGLQAEITSTNKLNADLVDDSTSTNKFVTSADKSAWNSKQNAIDNNHKLDADLVDDSNSTNKFNVQADWNQTTDTASDYIKNKPTLGTAAALDVATSGNASTSEVVKGDDTRLADSRNAADVYSWAKEANKPSYTGSEITLTGYAEAQSKASVAATDTTNAAIGKLEYRVETNETNILLKQDIIDSSHKLNADLVDDSTATNKFATAAQLSQIATNTSNIAQKIGASDYATQNTGGTVRAWTTTDGTSTTLHISTEAPSP